MSDGRGNGFVAAGCKSGFRKRIPRTPARNPVSQVPALRSRPSDVGFVMSDDPGFWSVFEIHPMNYGSGVPHGVIVKAQDV